MVCNSTIFYFKRHLGYPRCLLLEPYSEFIRDESLDEKQLVCTCL